MNKEYHNKINDQLSKCLCPKNSWEFCLFKSRYLISDTYLIYNLYF